MFLLWKSACAFCFRLKVNFFSGANFVLNFRVLLASSKNRETISVSGIADYK